MAAFVYVLIGNSEIRSGYILIGVSEFNIDSILLPYGKSNACGWKAVKSVIYTAVAKHSCIFTLE